MSYLLFGAIEDIKADLQRISAATISLLELGFDADHPAIIVLKERTEKLKTELAGLEANI